MARSDPQPSALERLEDAQVAERRDRFRETTMSERLEEALRLSAFAGELRRGMARSEPRR
jgi:hypothetical protein